jgi:hypothetical protein
VTGEVCRARFGIHCSENGTCGKNEIGYFRRCRTALCRRPRGPARRCAGCEAGSFSAAKRPDGSGTDLLALGVASEMGVRRRVLLPFARALFRETSVADRPGDWGERYDRVLNEVERPRDLVILGYEQSDSAACARTNVAIVDEALRIAQHERKLAQALVVWDEKSRGAGSYGSVHR